jgi:hypothetical protein
MMSAARVGAEEESGAEHDEGDEDDARDDADPGHSLEQSIGPALLDDGGCRRRRGERPGRGDRAGGF